METPETYLHLTLQHRSTRTCEIDMRAFYDRAWWNHRENRAENGDDGNLTEASSLMRQ